VTARRRCRSRSPHGDCHLPQGHPRPFVADGPDHAVAIGEGVMFGYFGGGRSATHAGYGVIYNGV
jgi:hypothetical protein